MSALHLITYNIRQHFFSSLNLDLIAAEIQYLLANLLLARPDIIVSPISLNLLTCNFFLMISFYLLQKNFLKEEKSVVKVKRLNFKNEIKAIINQRLFYLVLMIFKQIEKSIKLLEITFKTFLKNVFNTRQLIQKLEQNVKQLLT